MAEQPRKFKPAEDWDKDRFPTSAKPVFKSALFLVVLIVSFCAYLFYSSEEPTASVEERERRQEQILNDFLADEQLTTVSGFDL